MKRIAYLVSVLILMASFGVAGDDSSAASSQESDSALAKQTQNPIANLISVPFQDNTSYELGPRDRTQNVLNIQPVIPFSMTGAAHAPDPSRVIKRAGTPPAYDALQHAPPAWTRSRRA